MTVRPALSSFCTNQHLSHTPFAMLRHAFRHIIPIFAVIFIVAASSCSSRRHSSRGSHAYNKLKDSPSVIFSSPENGSGASAKAAAPLDKKQAELVVAESRRWLGTPYRYGQQTRQKGTDCSGLVMEVYRKVLDIKLPRSSREQRQFCSSVGRNSLSPGDLVFFSSSGPRGNVNHVGIYIGSNSMIHASTSRGVVVSSLDERYFASRYHSAGRVPGGKGGKQASRDKKKSEKAKAESKEVKKKSDAASSISLDQLLDDAINSQVDSIFSSFMD